MDCRAGGQLAAAVSGLARDPLRGEGAGGRTPAGLSRLQTSVSVTNKSFTNRGMCCIHDCESRVSVLPEMISQKAKYAFKALAHLAGVDPGTSVQIEEIA